MRSRAGDPTAIATGDGAWIGTRIDSSLARVPPRSWKRRVNVRCLAFPLRLRGAHSPRRYRCAYVLRWRYACGAMIGPLMLMPCGLESSKHIMSSSTLPAHFDAPIHQKDQKSSNVVPNSTLPMQHAHATAHNCTRYRLWRYRQQMQSRSCYVDWTCIAVRVVPRNYVCASNNWTDHIPNKDSRG